MCREIYSQKKLPCQMTDKEASSLIELCEILNAGSHKLDVTCLPTFGGAVARGALSWDMDNVLLDTGRVPQYEIVARADWLIQQVKECGRVWFERGVLYLGSRLSSDTFDYSGAPYWLCLRAPNWLSLRATPNQENTQDLLPIRSAEDLRRFLLCDDEDAQEATE